MAITNLTGTSWKCKSTATSTNFGKPEIDKLTACDTTNAYSLDLSIPDRTCDCLCWVNDSSIDANCLCGLKMGYSIWNASVYWIAYLKNNKFTITGGADATNSVLISWLEANADRLDCTITNDIEHCTLSPLTGEVGVAYTGTLTAETGYSVPASVYVNGTLYAVTNNQFTVPASAVTGDFHVTSTSTVIKDVALKDGTTVLYPQTKVRNIKDLTATAREINTLAGMGSATSGQVLTADGNGGASWVSLTNANTQSF